ncbi:SAM-dependent methyltransferase [Candidatus Pelagibacter sp.]|nr:SAM-dependent methyltransferase [Candidatus Pelagibacter sp.]
MNYNPSYFNLKSNKLIPVDEFVEKVLYEPNKGYYTKKIPFGNQGDFITAPTISNLFSEIIGIWIVSAWEKLGKPKNFNFIELGPGDGSLSKVLVETLKNFPKLNNSINIYLYEKSDLLKNLQKKKLKDTKIRWIKNFNEIKKGPIIFFGNEFFDALPIKQFLYKNGSLLEKCYIVNPKTGLNEAYKTASHKDLEKIKSFKILKGLKFIEYPKLGLIELDKMVKKIKKQNGGILLIDYGYLNTLNKNTLQTVMKNKKININSLFKNLGKADVTSLVNFSLLEEYFKKKKLNVKNIVSQKFFLEKMGIIERAKILEKNMNSKQLDYMSLTLMRLLHKDQMGRLFKVILAFKSKKTDFLGFK